MSKTGMNTQWRAEPIIPESYDDVAALLPLARKARGLMVDFDWELTADELIRLREAVHFWGAPTTGRYKKFDAQMLAAINRLLEEPDSAYVLTIPKRTEGVDSQVRGTRQGDRYRLSDHASFGVMFGYGWASLEFEQDCRLRHVERRADAARLHTTREDRLDSTRCTGHNGVIKA